MTELSGTLEGMGLSAIVRFLAGLKKTGCLRVADDDWHGEIVFEAGEVTGASFGSRDGLAALDALLQALPRADFIFETNPRTSAPPSIGLSFEALQTHLEKLGARIDSGTPSLPSADAVPEVVVQAPSAAVEDPLPLDRGTLQTLLVVDGKRTVRQVVAQRGSFDALWQLGSLATLGLVRLQSGTASESIAEPSAGRSGGPAVELEPAAGAHCPKLGFEDDPGNAFARPTRLHCCFATGAPLPLSLDQQRDLCLTDYFGTCPRLKATGRAVATPRAQDFRSPGAATGRTGSAAPAADAALATEAATHDPRIVRLPVVGRNIAGVRAAPSERQASATAQPPQHLAPSSALRAAATPRPMPLRARIAPVTTNADAVVASVAETAGPTRDPGPAQSAPARRLLSGRRLARYIDAPVPLIAAGAAAVIALAVSALLVLPQMGNLLGDDSADLSGLPNASAVASGTSVAQIAARRTPAASIPGGGANADEVNPTMAVPTALPEAAPTVGGPTPGISQARSLAQAPPAGSPSATTTLLDETFVDNARNWPSSPQGTAWLTNGSYHLIPRRAGQFVAVGVPLTEVPQDVVVSATFRKLGGAPPGGGFGIILRDQSPGQRDGANQSGQYYVLEVGDKGEVGIWRRDIDHWVDLLPWQHADAVHVGSATNELSVSAIGNRLSLSVNGAQIATLTDNAFSSGGVGVLVGGDGNQVALDHFSVQTP
ncbi:MAG: DUF4388 domain-containing protein [Chloroflexota bacterium]